jgi:tetratricopeptide (TPR) repeat protein
MMYRKLMALVFLATIVSGCGFADIRNTSKGDQYLKTGEYSEAETTFKKTVRNNPDDYVSQYYLGRFLFAQGKESEALPHFKKAVVLDPMNPDYQFWLGVTYGKLGDVNAERVQYERTLKIDGNYLLANLYLGHLSLQNWEFKQAIKAYDAVLKEEPTNATALYNRALSLDLDGKDTSAKTAWLKYLKWYPAGRYAQKATDRLNALGDFSYENHFLGRRTITLTEIKYSPSGKSVDISSIPSLRLVGAILAHRNKGKLQVVVYAKKDTELARQRALEIKKTLHELVPAIAVDRIQISWFGVPEKGIHGGKAFAKDQSVRFFLTDWKEA